MCVCVSKRDRERVSCLLGDIFMIDDYICRFVKLHVNGFCLSVLSCFYSAMSLIWVRRIALYKIYIFPLFGQSN